MNGRGVHFCCLSFIFLLLIPAFGFAVPGITAGPEKINESAGLERLCQDSGTAPDYSGYFTKPERDRDKKLVFVFYNNFIDRTDDAQFAYALIYGLEYASENAQKDDVLAVGVYFLKDKGKIYLIRKSVFDELQQQKITAEDLLDYLKVETVDLKAVSSLTTTTF